MIVFSCDLKCKQDEEKEVLWKSRQDSVIERNEEEIDDKRDVKNKLIDK